MRSNEALSFLGALCLIFGLGLATYQFVMSEAGTNSTWNVPHQHGPDRDSLAFRRAVPGFIMLGVGAGLLLAGAWFDRRSKR
jgi:hypothetical protein